MGLLRVALFVPHSPDRYLVAVRSALDRTDLSIAVGVLYPQDGPAFEGLGERVTWRPVGSVAELVNTEFARGSRDGVDEPDRLDGLVVLDDAVLLPPDPFATAASFLRRDIRYATVSFLSNASDFLSFPVRNLPLDRCPDGLDEQSITRLLRTLDPPAEPAPIVHATGAAVVVGAAAFAAVGELRAPHSARFDAAIADFSARARAKGFIDVLDASTYIARPSDVAVWPIANALTHDDRGWLLHNHRSLIAVLDRERMHGDSPLALAHQSARAKVLGLRVLVDGMCFGPNEVGTQVATQHLIGALAARPDVAEVVVALPGSVPAYASNTLVAAKVRTVRMGGVVVGGASPGPIAPGIGPVDVAYRPYQPVPGWDLAAWRGVAPRLVIGMLDTIAYHNGGYFPSSEAWIEYRAAIQSALAAADAVTVISEDVVDQMRLHQLPIPPIVSVVELGTDHFTGTEVGVVPAELAARGFGGGRFALVQGTNYTHKNRELAMAAHRLLWERGYDDLRLIVAGASVPHGTSRAAEAALGLPLDRVIVLPELRAEERNWLLRHAEFLWYPTSAEGFGLVPFEAARFGTPTVAVGFGPLSQLLGGAPSGGSGPGGGPGPDASQDSDPVSEGGRVELATSWSPVVLADAAERLLVDPARSRAHVEAILDRAAHYSWANHAGLLTSLFRRVLREPQRHPPTTG